MVAPTDVRVRECAGVGRFRTNNSRYGVAAPGTRPQAAATMTSVFVFKFPITQSFIAVDGYCAGCSRAVGAEGGTNWVVQRAPDRITPILCDGGGTLRLTSALMAPGTLIRAFAFTYSGTDFRLFNRHGQLGATVVTAGGATAGSLDFIFGDRPTSLDAGFLGQVICYYHVQGYAEAAVTTYLADLIDDLEQGRALPRMRTPVVNSDFLWDARDIVTAPGVAPTPWIDQLSSVQAVRVGEPEGFGYAARFI